MMESLTPAARLKLIRLHLFGIPVLAVIAGVFDTLEILLKPDADSWDIVGEVAKEGSPDHSGVTIQVSEPAQVDLVVTWEPTGPAQGT